MTASRYGNIITLNWAVGKRGKGVGEGKIGAAAWRPKVQKGWVTIISGLYRESLWGKGSPDQAGELRVEGTKPCNR